MQKKLSEIKPGEVLIYAGYEWIKLEQEGLCLMKDILEEREFDDRSNNWKKSELRLHLDMFFNNKFNWSIISGIDFLPFEIDLTSDDGMRDYGKCVGEIGLLTADLYRSNRHLLKPLKDWWWLATPHTCLSSYTRTMRCVTSTGMLDYGYVYNSRGVRPLCNLSSETLVSVPGEEKEEEAKEKNITELIKKWAVDRDITSGNPKAQMVKLMEEVGELANGINKDRTEQIIDSIGDTYVVLVILCMQLDLDINDCIKVAYEEIKDRKGKMINGTFVKEEDL